MSATTAMKRKHPDTSKSKQATPSSTPKQSLPTLAPTSATETETPLKPITTTTTTTTSPLTLAPKPARNTRRTKRSTNEGTSTDRNFWRKPGMSVFLDWFLDPVNNERLRSPKSSSSGGVHNKVADLHAEIVEYVKERSGTTWEISQVKTKIKYAREKYNRARNLIRKASTQGNIDEQTLRDMVLNMCPDYDRFHELYAVQEEGKQRNNVESDDDSGDSDEDEDNAVDNEKEKEKEKEQEIAPRLIEEQTTIRTHVQPSAKRLKESRYEAEDPKIESVLQKIINMVDSDQSNLSDLQESRKDLRRREQAMDERERAWMERWIQRENEHHILLSERRQAVEKELMERKQLVEKELAEMKAELKQERAEFKQEVSEFKQERAEFKKEVDEERERVQQIREELAAARIELELRTVSCKDK